MSSAPDPADSPELRPEAPDGGDTLRVYVAVGTFDAGQLLEAVEGLQRAGRELGTPTGEQALLAGFDPAGTDVVLVAVDGNLEDGLVLCRELRSRHWSDPLTILAVSQSEDECVMGRAIDAGADDCLPDPVGWPLLRRSLRSLLRSNHRVAELKERVGQLEAAQRIALLGSWKLDQENGEMIWSAQTFRILGLQPDEIHPNVETFSQSIHPHDRESMVQEIAEAADAGRSVALSYRVVFTGGAIRHVQLHGEPLDGRRPGQLHGTIQDVTEQNRMQEEIRRLAHYDSLTGLSNRRRFREQLERSIERARLHEQHMALLYMDLDQFKRINDTLGHSAGDQLLKHVAEVLFDKVRTTDIIARNVSQTGEVEVSRLGGDEFAIVLAELASPEDARQVAERILSAITTPIAFEEHRISTTSSIGIAVYPEDGEDAETLIKHADTAMYMAKERGRNTFEFFSDKMNEGILRRVALETHLRHALEREQLRVVYQPRMNLGSRKIVGLEALLRWDAPQLGPVQPKEFIPVAEDTGLIVPIGGWVLETACAFAKNLRDSGHGKVGISVNVSSRQFVHHDLRKTVVDALTTTGLDPTQLELEITESVLLEDDRNTAEVLHELKAMGISIALDDFGTGYSSIRYLMHLPLDTLKLDISVVRGVGGDPAAQGIATALIAMAHALNLKVTAEGVDQTEQERFLTNEGCDEIQGFLISGPVPPEDCAQFFSDSEDGGSTQPIRTRGRS